MSTVFQPHPCAALFPEMDQETFDALVIDMSENGLREPIVVDQHNRIVDGLNRYRACLKLDMTPKINRKTFDDREALRYSISKNLHRRHLTSSQRAAFAAEIATRKQGGNQAAKSPDAVSQPEAAAIMDVGERAVRSAVKVKRHSAELHEQVKANAIPLHVAEKRVREELSRHDKDRVRKASRPAVQPKAGAGIPAAYSALYAELDALAQHLVDRPLNSKQADDLVALLAGAIERVKSASTSSKRSDADVEG